MIKKRNSNLELLRIICMILIIAHHYSVHGGYETLTYNSLSKATIFIQLISLFGKVPCQIFALISGYFLINSKNKDYIKKIISIIIELYFYSIVILLTIKLFNIMPLTTKDIIQSLFPIFYENWYVINYILLLLIIPFLNPILLKIKKENYKKIIIIMVTLWSTIPTLTNFRDFNSWHFSNIDFMIVTYIIGSYIKLYYKNTHKNIINLILGLFFAIIIIVMTLISDYIGYRMNDNFIISQATYFGQLNSIIGLLCSIYIFIYFLNIKLESKLINKIASTILGVYILHDNLLVRKYLWLYLSPNINYVNFPYVHAMIKIFLVFLVCSIIEYIRNKYIAVYLNDWLINRLNNIFKKMKLKLKN